MNRTRTTWLTRALRTTALLLALICLGISGGTTLVHTDDLGSLRTFHAGRSVLTHTGTVSADGGCLACQWEASAYNPQVPTVPVARPHCILMPLPTPLSASVTPPPFVHTSPRAPPRIS